MPNYQITDPNTGKTVTVSGTKPPTQADAEEIFKTAGLRQTEQPTGPQMNPVQKVANFLGLGNTAGNIGAFGFNNQDQGARQAADQAFQQSQALIKQAQATTNPAQKKALLDQSRSIMQGADVAQQGFQQDLAQRQMNAGINENDIANRSQALIPGTENTLLGGLNQFALRRGLGQTAELGSYALPGAVTGAKAATLAGRVGQGAIQGAVSGGLQGVAGASSGAENLGQAAGQVAIGAGVGAGLGAAMTYGGEKLTETLPKVKQSLQETWAKIRPDQAQKLQAQSLDVQRIIDRAENPEMKTKAAWSGFRDMYQSVFPFSKKGNSFEKLKPEQTIDDMIKYGITGTNDEIQRKAAQISGDSGILTNIVDLGIDNVKNPNQVPLPDINPKELALDLGFSGKNGQSIVNDQVKRIASLKPGEAPGQTVLKEMVGLERKMTSQGYNNITDGIITSDNASHRLGRLQLDLAERLRDTINQYVGDTAVVKDPAITQFLAKVGGPKLAEDYLNASSVSELRSLQTPFVRMSKIIDLSNQLPSNLGNNYFGNAITSVIPAPIRNMGAAAFKPLGQSIQTGAAVGGQNLLNAISQLAPSGSVGQGVQNIAGNISKTALEKPQFVVNPSVAALQRMINKENQAKQTRTLLK